MTQRLSLVSLLVADYDEAIAFYVGTLGFDLIEDSEVSDGKRWVVVAPAGSRGCGLVLARAASSRQARAVGDQAGGRVFLFLETDDIDRDFKVYAERGVTFVEPPRDEAYGRVAVFTDVCGNRWDLIVPVSRNTPTPPR